MTVKRVVNCLICSVIALVCLLLILLMIVPKLNKGYTYKAIELPSELVADGVERKVEQLERVGCLTFGPYIDIERGKIKVEIFYSTDTNDNWIDVYSDKNLEVIKKNNLLADQNKLSFTAEINKNLSDLELRTHYCGYGSLTVDKIVLYQREEDLKAVIIIYVSLIIMLFIAYNYKNYNSYKKNMEDKKGV